MFRYTKLTAFRELLVWLVTLVGLLPFYLLIVTALKDDQEVLTTSAMAPPSSIDFGAFVEVLTTGGRNSIPMSILNSVIITVGAIAGLVLLGSITAYVIARRTQAWSNLTYYLVLIAIILPAQLGTVPLYIGARSVGLTGNALGMILLWIGILLPLSIFLYASFFRGLTTEYEEAAVIDGASPTQAFFRVVLPLMAPATGTVAILAGLIVWNDFFNSLIFLGGSATQTLPVAMYTYVGGLVSAWNKIFAVVIISMIPILLFYMFAQKRFIQGFAGGLKG
ncbi:raffinose/stachyose/melibiose transport system permease protein [Agromyces flavus]|uniref:Carbohydrate ABC transporter membrane protein 2, CUT1 family n=1 Tax=Agromyces flavus TaxID=589382 RepID=A0A1H1P368_9MICO|nr:carbohydrate ABC transporter permease [Agromyces flavus]MCP2367997.1 raffinose/stachyose/melibiose transport system permease protein [Agromyces flavus]GGI47459.1 sugar ABC transporter permease [Agromyces flavus]SDS05667.1 carbohydrate ABC transporter membrane protein 2, CUT1 family [Agromyces flavus]